MSQKNEILSCIFAKISKYERDLTLPQNIQTGSMAM